MLNRMNFTLSELFNILTAYFNINYAGSFKKMLDILSPPFLAFPMHSNHNYGGCVQDSLKLVHMYSILA